MRAAELISLLQVSPQDRQRVLATNPEITKLTANTKEVTPGSCFVAIHGNMFDGHDHLAEVFAAGAEFAVVERPVAQEFRDKVIKVPNTHKALAQLAVRFYHNPSRDLRMIGVTGTNGKTTVSRLTAKIMEDAGYSMGVIGTIGNEVGGENKPALNTTPDALQMQKLFAEMRDDGQAGCAMEVSSIALAQGRSWGVDFDTVIFTNLTEDHLDYHGTMEAYFEAKAQLFTQVGNGYGAFPKTAVINSDDEAGLKLIEMSTQTATNVLSYGIDGNADIRATNVQVSGHGTKFDIEFFGQVYHVSMRLIGKFNVYNVLAAFGAAYGQGLTPEQIIHSLENAVGVPGRFQVVPNEKGIITIIDYAHTPDGLENVLETIHEFANGKVYCVVGCGGDRDTNKRHIMGNIAVKMASNPVFTSDNPRTEDPQAILDQVTSQLTPDQYVEIPDRREAIKYAIGHAQENDVVLIAGKGHEDYQIIGRTKHHFSDYEEAEKLL
ncbi:UDP-N-acetylmuramoyl-L-alanyl-D-glutamate--2,6-diaminopimelate ligase [Lacticaseibacillus sharpeae]|nr:UDP-N-acetylmuramoyl-L-alanyl-D-glutamate--2,6-diaminopimelate ligase [Lacticaseibacillus sharpeae]